MDQPFRRLAIGAAFSPNLEANLCEAARLALFFNSELLLIHVGEETADKKEKLHQYLSAFVQQGLNYQTVFRSGDPVSVILNTTEEQQVDLLIIGAMKQENLLTYYVGSIARKITRNAKCSVLLHIHPSLDRVPCKHIVVNGLDQEQTANAIGVSCYLAHTLKAEKLTIVEEIDRQEVAVAVEDDRSLRKATISKERLRRRENTRIQNILDVIPKNYKEGLTINSQPIFGKTGYSIGHYAQVVRADLLVMNAPGKTNFWDRLFPHDIEHILSELPTDLLIINER